MPSKKTSSPRKRPAPLLLNPTSEGPLSPTKTPILETPSRIAARLVGTSPTSPSRAFSPLPSLLPMPSTPTFPDTPLSPHTRQDTLAVVRPLSPKLVALPAPELGPVAPEITLHRGDAVSFNGVYYETVNALVKDFWNSSRSIPSMVEGLVAMNRTMHRAQEHRNMFVARFMNATNELSSKTTIVAEVFSRVGQDVNKSLRNTANKGQTSIQRRDQLIKSLAPQFQPSWWEAYIHPYGYNSTWFLDHVNTALKENRKAYLTPEMTVALIQSAWAFRLLHAPSHPGGQSRETACQAVDVKWGTWGSAPETKNSKNPPIATSRRRLPGDDTILNDANEYRLPLSSEDLGRINQFIHDHNVKPATIKQQPYVEKDHRGFLCLSDLHWEVIDPKRNVAASAVTSEAEPNRLNEEDSVMLDVPEYDDGINIMADQDSDTQSEANPELEQRPDPEVDRGNVLDTGLKPVSSSLSKTSSYRPRGGKRSPGSQTFRKPSIMSPRKQSISPTKKRKVEDYDDLGLDYGSEAFPINVDALLPVKRQSQVLTQFFNNLSINSRRGSDRSEVESQVARYVSSLKSDKLKVKPVQNDQQKPTSSMPHSTSSTSITSDTLTATDVDITTFTDDLLGKDATEVEKELLSLCRQIANHVKGQAKMPQAKDNEVFKRSTQQGLSKAIERISALLRGVYETLPEGSALSKPNALLTMTAFTAFIHGIWTTDYMTNAHWINEVQAAIARVVSDPYADGDSQVLYSIHYSALTNTHIGLRATTFQEEQFLIGTRHNYSGWLGGTLLDIGLQYSLRKNYTPRHPDKGTGNLRHWILPSETVSEWYKTHEQGPLANTVYPDLPRKNDFPIVYMPIHLHNNHWVLAIVDRDAGNFWYADSLPGHDHAIKEIVKAWLAAADEASSASCGWEGVRLDVPKQSNGSDCGYWVIRNAHQFSRDRRPGRPTTSQNIRIQLVTQLTMAYQDAREDHREILSTMSPRALQERPPVTQEKDTDQQGPITPKSNRRILVLKSRSPSVDPTQTDIKTSLPPDKKAATVVTKSLPGATQDSNAEYSKKLGGFYVPRRSARHRGSRSSAYDE